MIRNSVLLLAIATTACGASRYTILTVPAVSMTNASFDADYKGVKIGPVEAKYCQGDAPIVSHDRNIGLIDEAIAKAEKQSGGQYLKDVTVSSEGACIVVEATAMK